MDAYENRSVATLDVPGAFLHTWLTGEKVIMVLRGDLCKLIVKVDPKLYTKYVTVDTKGQKVLYVQLSKALYGLLRALILFYRKLRKELEEYGFEINPYDPCVANKMTESGKQLTMLCPMEWPNELALAPGESAAMIAENGSRLSLQECVGSSETYVSAWQIAAVAA